MIRRAAGLLLVASLAGCGANPPSSPLTPPVPTGTAPPAFLRLQATGKEREPLPPRHFDPASVPAFYYFTGDGRVGVWSGPLGRPDVATALVDPVSEADAGYGTATRFPDGSVVVPFIGEESQLLVLRAGADPRVLVDRVAGATAAAPDDLSLVVARARDGEDDGVWLLGLDGSGPIRVLPPVRGLEPAGRLGVALSGDQSVAAAACNGRMQVAWVGAERDRVPLGIPVGFAADGDLIAFGDCARTRILRVPKGGATGEDLVPPEAGYQAVVTPDRRHLAIANPVSFPGTLVVFDLEAGERRTFVLADGGWDFMTDNTTDRFVVMRRDDGGGAAYRWTWGVHDLLEGWTGYFVVDSFPTAP
jgi:hypothetical protein